VWEDENDLPGQKVSLFDCRQMWEETNAV